jgi:predicted metal-dependent hydrolase
VELIVPTDWQAEEIKRLLVRKAAWIQDRRTFFRLREHGRIALARNEVMLFGEPFKVEIDESIAGGIEIDLANRRLRLTQASASEPNLQEWQRSFAKAFLSKRISELSKKHGLNFYRLFIRSQLTKWGSCSAKQNISLNWKLISAPKRVIDYVILHELLHTKAMNHNQLFWVHLRALCPWAKDAVEWLNSHQPEPGVKLNPPKAILSP